MATAAEEEQDDAKRGRWTRAASAVVIFPVRVYQVLISPLLGPTCRFHPTCSNYFIQAVKKYGVIRGVWRGMRRILRCHPLNPGGYDPP